MSKLHATELKPYQLYRISRAADAPELRGKLVTFYEERRFTRGDITRCRVRLVAADGSDGDEYLITRHLLLPL